jgi:hypothetical protein
LKLGRETDKPIGLNNADKAMFLSIGKACNAPFIIARGSRVKGYWIDSSDYDCVIWLPYIQANRVRKALDEFMQVNKIKIDAQVSNVATGAGGIMLEVNYG